MLKNNSESKQYDFDAINHYKDLRNMYSLTVDSIIDKLNLSIGFLKQNIFDVLTQNIE